MGKKTALVTGASRGIGRSVAKYLADKGYQVVGLARSAPSGSFPGAFRTADLSDAEATRAALAGIASEFEIDVLVNNAGIAPLGTVEEVTPETLQHLMSVNVRAPYQCMQAFLPGMRKRKFGRVVNIGSRAALGKHGRSAYAVTKGGIAAATRTWAIEAGGDGITVNCVAPGPIATEMFEEGNPAGSASRNAIEAAIPVKRIGQPEDVAAAVAFFASEDAGFCTGQVLYVCGGLTIGSAPL
ncbi:MAG: SDR family oxidoreductase [Nisaea sp.]|uniref:SDR family oxidoreductase n=1 Tax=Nisaea sp. TaxID=2024842 RepID=UPI001B21C373|nr:SDR family oxidoreductase [Nisaea sp.]MBO6562873.1 SDR family oxidoreductase [Nisaea sp.]